MQITLDFTAAIADNALLQDYINLSAILPSQMMPILNVASCRDHDTCIMLISRTCMPITLSALEISWDRAESVVLHPLLALKMLP